MNNSHEDTNGKQINTKTKREPASDNDNIATANTDTGKVPTGSDTSPTNDQNCNDDQIKTEPNVVYGTQPGKISETLKEMHKNLI